MATGAAPAGVAGGDALQRMDAIEAALAQLTSKTEALEFRVNQVVTDGTNRIGDMEFRLTRAGGRRRDALPGDADAGRRCGNGCAGRVGTRLPASGCAGAGGQRTGGL